MNLKLIQQLTLITILTSINAQSQTLTVPLLRNTESSRFLPHVAVSIGGQKFQLLVSTGNATTWVSKENCLGCPSSGPHSFIPQKPLPASGSIQIDFGRKSQIVCEPHFASIEIASRISAAKQSVCVATYIKEGIFDGFDGVLAIPSPWSKEAADFMAYLANVSEKKVWIYWKPLTNGGNGEIGTLGFGSVPQQAAKSIRWLPTVNTPYGWAFDKATLGYSAYTTFFRKPVVIDTSEIWGSFEPVVFDWLVRQFDAKYDDYWELYEVDEKHLRSMEGFVLYTPQLGNVWFSPVDFIAVKRREEGSFQITSLGIERSEDGSNILGSKFLARNTLVFDYENKNIGFGFKTR